MSILIFVNRNQDMITAFHLETRDPRLAKVSGKSFELNDDEDGKHVFRHITDDDDNDEYPLTSEEGAVLEDILYERLGDIIQFPFTGNVTVDMVTIDW